MGGGDLELEVAWQRHVGRGEAARRLFESVVSRHREPGRHYHDVRHVRWVVRHVRELAERVAVTDLDAIVAAAFFHDAIYEFDRDDNEARSAELAATCLRELDWDPDRCDRVAAMILATAHLTGGGSSQGDTDIDADTDADTDTAVLLAADLAVLGAEPEAYSDAVRRIRREYGHLDDAAWRSGRSAVLAGFLARRSIFPPALGLDAWERRARANLTAEWAALR
jgi:predicted metal-dependent HD superfamily phosphohydrolase